MTALNSVVIIAYWNDGGTPPTPASGNVTLIPSGSLIESGGDESLDLAPVLLQLDAEGALSLPGTAAGSGVPVLASDNFGAGVLTYNFGAVIQGAENIAASNLVIDYSVGATQGLFDILALNGVVYPAPASSAAPATDE